MENTETTENTQKISRKDVMRLLLDIMPDGEAEAMLAAFSYLDIQKLFNEPETLENVKDQVNSSIITYELLLNALKRIPSLMENKDELLQDYAIEHYNELSRESKREFCAHMMNQYDFQRDLCDTIFDEVEKQIPEVKPILDVLNVKKNFLSMYDNGGYHEYKGK